jgi:hypothetical protein
VGAASLLADGPAAALLVCRDCEKASRGFGVDGFENRKDMVPRLSALSDIKFQSPDSGWRNAVPPNFVQQSAVADLK